MNKDMNEGCIFLLFLTAVYCASKIDLIVKFCSGLINLSSSSAFHSVFFY